MSGEGPKTADCKANEVSVPRVIGMTEAVAVALLATAPLDAAVAYVPAKPGRLPGVVVNQDPRRGGLSAHDSVQLFVTKARHGLVPNFVGSSLQAASDEVRRLRLDPRAIGTGPRASSSGRASRPEWRLRQASRSGSWSGTAHKGELLSMYLQGWSRACVIPMRGPTTISAASIGA